MSLMREIEWGSCLLEPRRDPKFERRFRRATGRPGGPVAYYSGTSWLEDTTVAFNVDATKQISLDPELIGLIGMIVSQDNSCRFCFAETRALLLIFGMPERRISRLEHHLLTEEFSERERAALEFARCVSRANPLPGKSDLEKLKAAGYDELEITEIASIAGLFVFFNRVTTFFALPPYAVEEMPNRWYVRFFRPLIAFWLSRSNRPARLQPLEPDEREGMFTQVVLGLDGLPFARSLRKAIDGMWASTVLTRRSKALAMAVVARALDCPLTEKEVTETLLEEGLQTEQVGEILAHLTSPALEPKEKLIVSFARETVWYEPARVQQLGRDAMRTLSREEFIELVAVTAMANMICRLGAVVCAS
jgi:alkylhydroperoxidase family enzyme